MNFNLKKIIQNTDRATLLAALSGVLVIVIFPGFNLSFLAWAAFIPLLFAVEGQKAGRSFRLGFLAGFISFMVILHWVVPTVIADGEHPVFAVLVLIVFSSVLASFYGVFCLVLNLLQGGRKRRVIFNALLAAALWVVVEWLRGHFLSGFPWMALGYSQWQKLTVIQISEITAVYGVSFLVMFVNVVLKSIIGEYLNSRRFTGYIYITVIIAVIGANSIYGYFRIKSFIVEEPVESARVGILQGNIDQYMKWDAEYEAMIINSYTELVNGIVKDKPDLILWPETAVPGYLRLEKGLNEWVSGLARFSGAYHVIGSPEYENNKYYNSAFLISPDGNILQRYDKIHLVPVGEFVPFRAALEKVFRILDDLGDFSSGSDYQRFRTPFGVFGTVICFESIFPDLTRRIVGLESDYLVNITNDAWYLRTSALEQHFAMNVFRAVENRINLVRAANTGISGFINKYGGIEKKTEIMARTYLTKRIGKRERVTFYTRFGDVFAYLCMLFVVLMGIMTLNRRYKYAG